MPAFFNGAETRSSTLANTRFRRSCWNFGMRCRSCFNSWTDRRAPSGHPDDCPVRICLILLKRVWSKLDVHVIVCEYVGAPFKAWVAGSSPAALTKLHRFPRPSAEILGHVASSANQVSYLRLRRFPNKALPPHQLPRRKPVHELNGVFYIENRFFLDNVHRTKRKYPAAVGCVF